MSKLICICCEKQLQPIIPDGKCYQPEHGLTCQAFGNYGSTKFDPLAPEDRGYLLFFICDECIVAKKKSVYFVRRPADAPPVPATKYLR